MTQGHLMHRSSAYYTIVLISTFLLLSASRTLCQDSPLKGRFIHITDIHLDTTYVEGASVQEFCHQRPGQNQTQGASAGRFGTVGSRCDAPESLVQLTFDFIKTQGDTIDFILYTGDSAPHDRDDAQPQTQSTFESSQQAVIGYFTKSFDVSKTKVIPVIGNNDVAPHNICGDSDKHFTFIKELWKPLGLNITTDFDAGGYYTHDIIPGKLRALNVNSLLFFKKNKKAQDCDIQTGPGAKQISWIARVLDDSRQQGYKVYILSHIPPNDKNDQSYYLSVCYTAYNNLLGKYSDVIVGHFSGHHNHDMLTTMFKIGEDSYGHLAALPNQAPVLPATLNAMLLGPALYSAPSVYPRNNPAFRIVEYETTGTEIPFGTIRDWYQYYVNLSGTNNAANGNAAYELEYQASKLYGVDRFDAAGIHQVFTNLATNEQLHAQYSTYFVVSTPVNVFKEPKDESDS